MQVEQNILKALEDSTATFAEFKRGLEARVADLETGDAKSNRLRLGNNEIVGANSPEVKAYRRFIQTGDDAELKSLATSTNSGADGGYAVPKVIDGMIDRVALSQSPIRSIARAVQISTPDFHTLVASGRAASGWVSEVAARPATTSPAFTDIKPTMGEIYCNIQATQQVLDDVFFNADTWLAEEIGQRFAEQEASAFINGSGTNQPTGFLSGTAPVATDDASRAFGTLQYVPTGAAGAWAASSPQDVLLTMMFKLKVAYRQDACWVMHPTVLQTVMGFKDSYGRYIFQPAMQAGAPATLWGYPVVEAEHMPAIAANSFSVAFGNFQRGYLIVDRIGTRVLRDPFSNKPYVGFYASKRTGGILTNTESIKLLKFAVS